MTTSDVVKRYFTGSWYGDIEFTPWKQGSLSGK